MWGEISTPCKGSGWFPSYFQVSPLCAHLQTHVRSFHTCAGAGPESDVHSLQGAFPSEITFTSGATYVGSIRFGGCFRLLCIHVQRADRWVRPDFELLILHHPNYQKHGLHCMCLNVCFLKNGFSCSRVSNNTLSLVYRVWPPPWVWSSAGDARRVGSLGDCSKGELQKCLLRFHALFINQEKGRATFCVLTLPCS